MRLGCLPENISLNPVAAKASRLILYREEFQKACNIISASLQAFTHKVAINVLVNLPCIRDFPRKRTRPEARREFTDFLSLSVNMPGLILRRFFPVVFQYHKRTKRMVRQHNINLQCQNTAANLGC